MVPTPEHINQNLWEQSLDISVLDQLFGWFRHAVSCGLLIYAKSKSTYRGQQSLRSAANPERTPKTEDTVLHTFPPGAIFFTYEINFVEMSPFTHRGLQLHLCNHRQIRIENISITPEFLCTSIITALVTIHLLPVTRGRSCLFYTIIRAHQKNSFSMFLRFIHVVTCIGSLFLFLIMNMPFIYLFTCWWTVLSVMNRGAMNTMCSCLLVDTCFHFSWGDV